MKKEIVIKIDEEKLKLIRKHGLADNYILCDAATKAIRSSKSFDKVYREAYNEGYHDGYDGCGYAPRY